MKEENIQRAKRIVNILEDKRWKLSVINMPKHKGFSVSVDARNNESEPFRSISLGEKDIPQYLEEIVLSTAIRELERQIKALEDELEAL